MDKKSLYLTAYIPDANFPIVILTRQAKKNEQLFTYHWHEQIEFLFFIEGKASIECNNKFIVAEKEDLLVINSNDLHFGESITDNLYYFVIMMDISLLQSNFNDTCESKYIKPISQNLILFENIIKNDKNINLCITNLINEYEGKNIGFELAVKSQVYQLLTLLLRNYMDKILTPKEYTSKANDIEKLSKVIQYIDENYSEEISVEHLSELANYSTYYFCHVFKKSIGKTPVEYINSLRIKKAEVLLKSTNMTITEVALTTGFNDANYFSRIFRKYKNISPTDIRNNPLGNF